MSAARSMFSRFRQCHAFMVLCVCADDNGAVRSTERAKRRTGNADPLRGAGSRQPVARLMEKAVSRPECDQTRMWAHADLLTYRCRATREPGDQAGASDAVDSRSATQRDLRSMADQSRPRIGICARSWRRRGVGGSIRPRSGIRAWSWRRRCDGGSRSATQRDLRTDLAVSDLAVTVRWRIKIGHAAGSALGPGGDCRRRGQA